MVDFEKDEDRAVARLLSGRGSLSRPEHESIAAAVLNRTAAEAPEAAPTRWWWPAGFAALLAVGLAVWLLPDRGPAPEEPEAFVARGDAEGPQLQLRCEPSACTPGGQVLLEVAETAEHRHVAVFSFRDDGVVIWYAPDSTDGTSAPPSQGRPRAAAVSHRARRHPPAG